MSGIAALRSLLVLRGASVQTSAREISRLLAVPYLWSLQPREVNRLSGPEYGNDVGRNSPSSSLSADTRGGVSTLWQQLQRHSAPQVRLKSSAHPWYHAWYPSNRYTATAVALAHSSQQVCEPMYIHTLQRMGMLESL